MNRAARVGLLAAMPTIDAPDVTLAYADVGGLIAVRLDRLVRRYCCGDVNRAIDAGGVGDTIKPILMMEG